MRQNTYLHSNFIMQNIQIRPPNKFKSNVLFKYRNMMETVSLVIRSDTGKFEIVHSNTRRIDVKFSWIFGDLS